MKLATLLVDGVERVCEVDSAAEQFRPLAGHHDMVDVITTWPKARARLGSSTGWRTGLGERLLAPILSPRRNVFCVGKNYPAHAAEFARSGFDASQSLPDRARRNPAVFTKPGSTVVGSGAVVPLQAHVTQQVDYETELAVVIGRWGCDIAPEAAYEHIFGYTILNDLAARNRQRNHSQWFLGKGLDGFCPMGPWITTADEVDPGDLHMQSWVNGDLRQDAKSREMIFDVPKLISIISAGLTLHPGDIIATGTPAGVGVGFDPPRFLTSGDCVRISIEGLGILENRFE